MTSFQKKQMLYVSIKDINTYPILCFEIEDYYGIETRTPYTEIFFRSLDQMEIFSDSKLMHDFGFSLGLGLLTPLRPKGREPEYSSQVVYTNVENGRLSLRIDEELYRTSSTRRFCTSYLLETLDKEKTIHNSEFCTRLASTAMNILLPEK